MTPLPAAIPLYCHSRWAMLIRLEKRSGVATVFEGAVPVGDKQANFRGTDAELFPHVLGGIHPSAVLQVHKVLRAEDGVFLSASGVSTE
ncbi:MAG: hypothetical protein ACI87W_002137 [Halieaceae bacterium]|jgi:hypothetical protein